MRKELVNYIGGLLFGPATTEGESRKLCLHSEKQFRVNREGKLEREQSVLTDIVVEEDTIHLRYLLPDGREVSFVNAVRKVDCNMNNDYTIGRIVYETEPVKMEAMYKTNVAPASQVQRLFFTLDCSEEGLRFYEDAGTGTDEAGKVLFEIQ